MADQPQSLVRLATASDLKAMAEKEEDVKTKTKQVKAQPIPESQQKMGVMDGNAAAVHVAYGFSEFCAIYPITPSSPMAEAADMFSAQKRINMFGDVVRIKQMQSEHGAAGAMHGALAGGALASTFTASQGLLLMVPAMFRIAGNLFPSVFHVAARSVGAGTYSIHGDHSDVMSTRHTGFALLSSHSVQEVMDLAVISHISTLKAQIPFIHFFDGFQVSHLLSKIHIIDYESMKRLIPWEGIKTHKRNAMNPAHPQLRGQVVMPDAYMQTAEAINKYHKAIPALVEESMREFGELFGRKYKLMEYVGSPDAEYVLVAMGAGAPIIEEAVEYLQKTEGLKVGIIKVHLYRPWSAEHFLKELPKTCKRIAVLDRTKEPGSQGEPLYLDVVSTIHESDEFDNVKTIGGRYALGNKDFTPVHAVAVFRNLMAEKPRKRFVVGIEDDVTNLSLRLGSYFSTIPSNTTECIFWGMGSDGTVGANIEAIKIIGNGTDQYVQCQLAFSSHKSGGRTVSQLRFGPSNRLPPYPIAQADYVACHHISYMNKFSGDMIKALKKNGVFVYNTVSTTLDALEVVLPPTAKRAIAEKNAQFYVIDAGAVASAAGLGKRINMVLQTVFFKLSGILPIDVAVKLLKESITKAYIKKGEKIVAMNHAAVDSALAGLVKVDYPASWAGSVESEKDKAPIPLGNKAEHAVEFRDKILLPMADLKGDLLPVSAFEPGGKVPTGTTQYEKRGIAASVPVWKPANCTQCNHCSLLCPHAAIRPFVITEDEQTGAPKTEEPFDAIKAKGAPGYLYRIQVAPFDCTGCNICVEACPDNALEMKPMLDVVKLGSGDLWDYAISLPTHSEELFKEERKTIRGSQFQEPLVEFSGACEGCGETAYAKLLTQLYGERLNISSVAGCTGIWAGCYPASSFTVNKKTGRGPTYSLSLFEDGAEYGYGQAVTLALGRARLGKYVRMALDTEKEKTEMSDELRSALQKWYDNRNDPDATVANSYIVVPLLTAEVEKEGCPKLLEEIFMLKDAFVHVTHWIIGGDGWAFDIGFGGLDHVIAAGLDINIMVLDNEVYANTGGQGSKATPIGAVAKFFNGGKRTHKKDLATMAMSYGDVYVASCCLEANYNQALKCIVEANDYPGTSIVLCYAPCIAWGIDGGMGKSLDACKAAVESGYWNLFRYNPLERDSSGVGGFNLDSKRIKRDLRDFLSKQNRFNSLMRSFKDVAGHLQDDLKVRVKNQLEGYQRLNLGDRLAALDQEAVSGSGEGGVNVTIVYISDTGNAEGVAQRLAASCRSRGLTARCIEADDCMPGDLRGYKGTVLVVASTCGQGDIPDNGKEFYAALTSASSDLENDALEGVKFGVFGLGDSSYIYYNKVAIDIDAGLKAHGAEGVCKVGLGNDMDDDRYNTALEEWEPEFFEAIGAPAPQGGLAPALYEINVSESESKDKANVKVEQWIPHGAKALTLTETRRLTPDDYDRDIRHYALDISGGELRYSPADALAIYPHNDPAAAKEFAEWYGLNPSEGIKISPLADAPKVQRFPEGETTAQQLFEEIIDVFGRPPRSFLLALAEHCTDDEQKAKLERLGGSSAEGKAEFKAKVEQEMPNYADILREFPAAHPPLAVLISMIPSIRPRYYSIASSMRADPKLLDLCIVLVDWTVVKKVKGDTETRYGLCTSYLKSLKAGPETKIVCNVRTSGMQMPIKETTPIVMAGLGTGIAPFRSFVLDRVAMVEAGKKIGELALYYGARHRKTEFLYDDMFESANTKGVLTRLNPAFSRDQDHKIYVHHRIEEDAELIHDLLVNKKGFFYYCGSGGRAVAQCKEGIVKAFVKAGMSTVDAEAFLKEMRESGRYNEETWG